MESSEDLCNNLGDGDCRANISTASGVPSTSTAPGASSSLAIGRQSPYQLMAGRDAEVATWRQLRTLFGMIVVATVAWVLFEHSGLPFLSLCSDVFLILTILLFLRANFAAFRKKQLQTLPELVLTEEMVNNAAASFRAKVNYMLLMAHDITLGKDFILFFKAVIFLWLLSAVGTMVSFFTIAYIGSIIFIVFPALYNRFEDHIDGHFSRQYKVVDESLSRLPQNMAKDKDI
ncbi:unnamed protein product [Cuscuta europaea]|uniref:Reticulon-like protein n=1 Tax=Cuscuta europaea TaxID=41803 RepID=A0A9P0ZD39_CUSEU|nr:unnamed protein product [Cuscuta europaea]